MFYVNKEKKFKPIPPSQIHNILIIPYQQRQIKDHQLVYRYFIDHPVLNQIERAKSVNARMKCVATIQLLSKNQFKQQNYIFLAQVQQHIASLSLKKKIQYEQFDQKVIRQKMENLSRFKLFSLMKYNELLFLAQTYHQSEFKYMQYLYKQNDKIFNFYLVENGQFHYVKCYQQQQNSTQKQRTNIKKSLKKARKISNTSFPFFNQQSINRVPSKSKKNKQYRVGFVQGGCGQSIGEEQIVLQICLRQYGAKCFSVNNKVLIFNKMALEIILSQNQDIKNMLRKQIIQKHNTKKQLIQNIRQTKVNMPSVISLIQKQKIKQKTKQQNLLLFQNQLNNFKLPALRHKHANSQLIDINRKFSSMSRVKEKNVFTNDVYQKHQHSDKQKSPFFKTQQIDQQSETFALTQFKKIKTKEAPKQQISIQRHTLIQDVSFDDSIKVKVSKSWNVNPLSQQSKKKFSVKQKYIGMIDSSTLVKQKQYIVSIKRDKQVNDVGKQFQIRQKALWRLMQKQKQKQKVKSPAHSKNFMEKMLLSALRKAGYNEAAPIISTQISLGSSERQFSQQFYKESQLKQRLKKSVKNKKKCHKNQANSQVLQQNPFDECYFGKINRN